MIEGSYDYHHYMQVCLAAVSGRVLRTQVAKIAGVQGKVE